MRIEDRKKSMHNGAGEEKRNLLTKEKDRKVCTKEERLKLAL